MKNLITIIAILLFLSACNASTSKEAQPTEKTKETTTKLIKTAKNKEQILKLESITQTLNTLFDIQNIELKDVNQQVKNGFYEFLDSTKIKSFKALSELYIIEFDNTESAAYDFGDIKTVAPKSLNNLHQYRHHEGIFKPGGRSFNQIQKWIIVHDLGCEMHLKDYEIDKKLTVELRKLGSKVDWLRSGCAWGELEMKERFEPE